MYTVGKSIAGSNIMVTLAIDRYTVVRSITSSNSKSVCGRDKYTVQRNIVFLRVMCLYILFGIELIGILSLSVISCIVGCIVENSVPSCSSKVIIGNVRYVVKRSIMIGSCKVILD